MQRNTIVIIMAAGKSSRFGSDKRFAALPDGTYVIETLMNTVFDSGMDYRLVIKPEDLDLDFFKTINTEKIVINPNYEEGLSSSLGAGIRSVEMIADSCLILPADMPFISSSTLCHLETVLNFSECLAAVPIIAGQARFGHPVAIKKNLFFLFSHLDGDKGGRDVLESIGDLCLRVEVDDPGIYLDIDTPQDIH